MSLDHLSPKEKEVFYELCYLNSDLNTTHLLSHHLNLNDILETLSSLSIIKCRKNDQNLITSISIHKLTQDVGRLIFEQTVSTND